MVENMSLWAQLKVWFWMVSYTSYEMYTVVTSIFVVESDLLFGFPTFLLLLGLFLSIY
jgi:hypothetical protein